jgi:hypothetical protein
MLEGARGRRLKKLMIEQQTKEHFHQFGNHLIRKKEIIHEPEELLEINEVIEKRCCICLEEMRART